MTTVHAFPPGYFLASSVRFDIPNDLAADTNYEYHFKASISAAYAGIESTPIALIYRVTDNDSAPGTDYELTKTFSSADGFTAFRWKECKFHIPYAKLSGNEGGEITFWFFVLSSSTGPKLFVNQENLQETTTAQAEGFYFVT